MPEQLQRLRSGVEGLDAILSGGFVAGSSYIIQGRPGAGKTILANQIAFYHAASGQHVLYVTLLAEAHERLFENLSTLEFYDPARVNSGVDYVSAFTTMRDEGLKGVVHLLRQEIGRKKTTLLVMDGLLNIREKAETTLDVKTFIAELQGHAAFAGCTVIFLTSARLDDASPEHTMVDGVIELGDDLFGVRAVRRLQVRKSRGSKALRGLHQMEILDRGIVVHPRLEAILSQSSRPDHPSPARITSGIANLDEMTGGGFPEGSATLVIGPSGSGKTTLGLYFLAQATPEQPALHFGFYETPERLKLKARAVGLDLNSLIASGALELIWQPPTENLLDGLGHKLLEAVRRQGSRRVLVDGFGGFQRAVVYPPRLVEFLTAIMNELRARNVTMVGTWEMRDLFGTAIEAPSPEISSIIDNMVLLRFVDWQSRLRRLLSILKVRDSAFDPSFREFVITERGIDLTKSFEHAQDVLAGTVRPANANP